ncbi:MAG: ABC transporter ATP-binding protein [Candidatus Heimdallarchaeota archaeon]
MTKEEEEIEKLRKMLEKHQKTTNEMQPSSSEDDLRSQAKKLLGPDATPDAVERLLSMMIDEIEDQEKKKNRDEYQLGNKPVISVKDVSKIFGRYISRARVTSLRNINFDVYQGERICLFGPNGAGKSTIMKAILGLIRPTSGKVFVKGMNVRRNQLKIKKIIGFLPSDLNFFLDTPCRESLVHFAILRGMPFREAKEEADRILEMIGLKKWYDLPPKLMSSGMRQRFSLAMAIIGDPEIIFFDEPVAFIDVQGRMKIYQLIQDYTKDRERTLIMSTHNIQEAMIMSDRIIVIDRGQILVDGEISEVVTSRCKSMEIILSDERPSPKIVEDILGDVEYEISGRKIIVKAENALQISIDIINKLQENHISVFSFRPLVEQKRIKSDGVEEVTS